jgi:hypothetical protein
MFEHAGAGRLICVNVGRRLEPTMRLIHEETSHDKHPPHPGYGDRLDRRQTARWLALARRPLLRGAACPWEALLSWQQSLATFNNYFWEQWAVRYAGGMPIDG